jgi:hypothetical protein
MLNGGYTLCTAEFKSEVMGADPHVGLAPAMRDHVPLSHRYP